LTNLIAASGNQLKGSGSLQKTLAVAQIAIDTAKAIVGAIAQAQSVPYPGNLVAIATGVAAVVAGIASAVSTLNTANVGGSLQHHTNRTTSGNCSSYPTSNCWNY
jgi:hypothetical protein